MKIETAKQILKNFEGSVKLCEQPCDQENYLLRAESMLVSERDAMDALASIEPENDEEREEWEALDFDFSYFESVHERTIRLAREATGHEDW